MTTFSAQIEQFARETNEGIAAVHKESVKRLAAEMNTLRGQGGDVPFLSGFLWASFDAELGLLPTVMAKPKGGSAFTYNPDPVNAIIDEWEPDGPDIHLAWRADYARRLNYGWTGRSGYLFLELGIQKWRGIVAAVQAEQFAEAA